MSERIFFTATDLEHGNELWMMTGAGTAPVLVADITPGTAGSSIHDFVSVGERVVFQYQNPSTGNWSEVWVSDGTAAGTHILRDFNPDSVDHINGLVSLDDSVIFSANGGLWLSDGTDAGTHLIKDEVYASSFYSFGDKILFRATNGGVWVTDGTEGGTELITSDIYQFNVHVNGDLAFFSEGEYVDSGHRWRLWVTDGTAAGTSLIKEVLPVSGEYLYEPYEFWSFGDLTLFVGSTGTEGQELWVSDGTSGGTFLLKDISPGAGSSNIYELAQLGGLAVFAAEDDNGRELWVTDGTSDGTRLLKDILPGSGGSDLNYLTAFGNKIYLSANDGIHGSELWVTDGTEEGTQLLKDINPNNLPGGGGGAGIAARDASPSSYGPSDFTPFNGLLYFAADDGVHGRELWVTDGTEAGTRLVKDINPTGYGNVTNLQVVGGKLYFRGDNGTSGQELWVSDGTSGGTRLVGDLNTADSDSYPGSLVEYAGRAFFTARGAEGTGLYVLDSDGSVNLFKGGTTSQGEGNSQIGIVGVVNEKLVFRAFDSATGSELWSTDGTPEGTQLLKDINLGTGSSEPNGYMTLGDKLIFRANDGEHGYELWVTDGTAEGTQLLKDINVGPESFFGGWNNQFVLGNRIIFDANDTTHGVELWVTDGTTEGTMLLSDISPGAAITYVQNVIQAGDQLYFEAYSYDTGRVSFWVTDGTTGGTRSVSDSGNARIFGVVGDTLIYSDYIDGQARFFATDGTPEGTVPIELGGQYPNLIATLGNQLIYAMNDQLWSTDGTSEGTTFLQDLVPSAWGGGINLVGRVNGELVLATYDYETSRYSLWKTDGTADGTVLIKEDGAYSNANDTTLLGGKLIFAGHSATSGQELWVTDGTEEGTSLLRDIAQGSASSQPYVVGVINGKAIFSAEDDARGRELWVTDGTSEGTTLLMDIYTGTAGSNPNFVGIFNGKLYFSASTAEQGNELWVTDGTSEGTQLARNINIASDGSYPSELTLVDAPGNAPVIDGGDTAAYTVAPGVTDVADLNATDPDASDTITYAIAGGPDGDLFVIDPATGELTFVPPEGITRSGSADGNNIYKLLVSASDQHAAYDTQLITVTFENSAPTGGVAITGTAEVGEVLTAQSTLADVDRIGTLHYNWQRIVGGEYFGIGSDQSTYTLVESDTGHQIRVVVSYTDGHGYVEGAASAATTVGSDNDPPSVALINALPSIAENTSTASRIKVADIVITDDAIYGNRQLSLTGRDAMLFEIIGMALFLKAGLLLDASTMTDLQVAVTVDDDGIAGSPDGVSSTLTLTIADVANYSVIRGTPGNDKLAGLPGDDYFLGNGGEDEFRGGAGNDTYVVDSAKDKVVEGRNQGTDTVLASVTHTLASNVENLTLTGDGNINGTGNSSANIITGNAGDNVLKGGSGNDTIFGGAGNDRIDGDSGNDLIDGGEGNDYLDGDSGTDTVSYASATGSVTVNLSLRTAQNTGGAGTDTLKSLENVTGSAFADTLTGSSKGFIDGGAGADSMWGGSSTNTYFVDNEDDAVFELARGGTDTVMSSVSFTLGANVENLTLTGTAAIHGTGNALDNRIAGNSAANELTGGAGDDTFIFNTALGNVDTITDFNVADDRFYIDNAFFVGVGGNGTLSSRAFVFGTEAADKYDRIIYDNATGALYFDADGTGAGAKVQFALLNADLALTNRDFLIV